MAVVVVVVGYGRYHQDMDGACEDMEIFWSSRAGIKKREARGGQAAHRAKTARREINTVGA